jgi:hypothetical protein
MAAESRLPRDYWEENGHVFVHFDKRYALAPNLRTICLGPVTEIAVESQTDIKEPSQLAIGGKNESILSHHP